MSIAIQGCHAEMHPAHFGIDFSRSLVVGVGGLMVTSSPKVTPYSLCDLLAWSHYLSMRSCSDALLASCPSRLDGLQINKAISHLAKYVCSTLYSLTLHLHTHLPIKMPCEHSSLSFDWSALRHRSSRDVYGRSN